MLVYHITHRRNLKSVKMHGLQPCMATGKRQVVWVVRGDKIAWAVAHVARHHGWTVSTLRVLPVPTVTTTLRRTCWAGVYTCSHVLTPGAPL